jgi:hypothetical protein
MNCLKLRSKIALLGCLLFASVAMPQEQGAVSAHEAIRQEADKQIDDYLHLVKLGYTEQEILDSS